MKAKINTSRCLPLVAQADGCAICMKVCPVQRYGLDAVWEHWAATGRCWAEAPTSWRPTTGSTAGATRG